MTLEERLRAYDQEVSAAWGDDMIRGNDTVQRVGADVVRENDAVREDSTARADDAALLETIRVSKKVLYESELEVPMSAREFLFQQAGYIRKRWWAAQGAVLAVLWGMLYLSGSSVYAQRSMGVMTVLFVVFLMPELWKNQNSASMEIEGASYFSLRKIYAARMLLFAMADVLMLSVFFLASSFTLKLTAEQFAIQFLLPMNVTCGICFGSLSTNRAGSGYGAFAGSLIWTAFWLLVVVKDEVYQRISGLVWMAAVIVSVIYLVYSIRRVWKRCGQYWEVNLSWN